MTAEQLRAKNLDIDAPEEAGQQMRGKNGGIPLNLAINTAIHLL